MDDTIFRRAAIDALSNGALVNYQNAGHNNGLVKAIDVIKGLPTAQQWISCSDMLPVEGETVLLCGEGGYMGLGRIIQTHEGNKWDMGAWWNDIEDWAAWMPLPEPYNQEDKQ